MKSDDFPGIVTSTEVEPPKLYENENYEIEGFGILPCDDHFKLVMVFENEDTYRYPRRWVDTVGIAQD